jgi:tripartite tricarboxylate transporter TctB family protein
MTAKTSFAGEDENAGFASPKLDLIAAGFLAVLSIWIMVEAFQLKMPGDVSTFPGLMPIVTAGSLLIMAGMLGFLAWKRRGTETVEDEGDEEVSFTRTTLLFAFIGSYILALDLVPFTYRFDLFGTQLVFGAFETHTTITLTLLLAYFWRAGLMKALAVGALWTVSLAGVFRYVFEVPLPGSF